MKTHPRLQKILTFLAAQNHRFASFTFTKKNGDVRHLNARLEFDLQLTAEYPFATLEKGLLPVRDLDLFKQTGDTNKSSRFVNCAGPVTVRAGGQELTF